MNTISKDVPGLDLTRFDQFLEATNVPRDGVDDTIAKHPPNFPRCRAVVSFDLEHSGDLMAKSYFLPHWRALQSRIPAKTIISDAVRACKGPGGLSYDGSLDAIMSYLSRFEGQEDAPPVGFSPMTAWPTRPGCASRSTSSPRLTHAPSST